MAVVKVVKHPETGNVITVNVNKPEYGTIRLDQKTVSMENGFLNKTNRTVFIGGTVEDLTSMNYKDQQVIAGKIIRKESFTPFFEGQSPKINPSTQEIITKDDKPVYMQDSYTTVLTAGDEWVGDESVELAEQTQAELDSQEN